MLSITLFPFVASILFDAATRNFVSMQCILKGTLERAVHACEFCCCRRAVETLPVLYARFSCAPRSAKLLQLGQVPGSSSRRARISTWFLAPREKCFLKQRTRAVRTLRYSRAINSAAVLGSSVHMKCHRKSRNRYVLQQALHTFLKIECKILKMEKRI